MTLFLSRPNFSPVAPHCVEQRSRGRGWIHIQGVEMVGLGVGMGGFRDQGVETGRFRPM